MFHPISKKIYFHFRKVGEADYARDNFRRLLVFASHAPTSAPTATATAYTPCPASYTDYTRGHAVVLFRCPCASATRWHAGRGSHQLVVHGEACRTAHDRRPRGQNGGVSQGDEKRAVAEGFRRATGHGSGAASCGSLRR